MRKVLLLGLLLGIAMGIATPGVIVPVAEAAQKKSAKGRNDYTPAQRAKLMEQARKICVKKYGATSRVYKIEYTKMMVICTQPGW